MSFKDATRCLSVSMAFAAMTASAEKNWPSSGTAIIPSGENWTITADDVANVAALDEIAFEDATAGATYTASTELALKAKLSGAGSFAAVGGNKVTFSGDSRDFAGVIAITNTICEMASRYGLGSVKSRLILHQDTAGDRFFVSATGDDCMIDTPILFSGGIKFGPKNSADTLVISNDLIEVQGGSSATTCFYIKGNLHQVAGKFGAKKDNIFPSIGSKFAWTIDGDTVVEMPSGNLYCMFGNSASRLYYGVTNIVKSGTITLNAYTSTGTCIFTKPNVGKADRYGVYLGSTAANPPGGYFDLNGLDQEFIYLGTVNYTEANQPNNYYVITSEKPATLTLNWNSTSKVTSPVEIRGHVALNVVGKGNNRFKKPCESDGELRVGGSATVTLYDTGCWAGTNIVIESSGKLDCQSATSITKGVAALEIKDTGVLNIAADVEVVVCSLKINGDTLADDRTYTVSDLAEMGYGSFVTGSGSIRVEEYVPTWTGWPTQPGQRVTIPPSATVDVDSSEDLAKALACREIVLKGGSALNFNTLTEGLLVTNTFSGYGTVSFKDATLLYMDSDASNLKDPGHISFDLCDTVIVSNAVAIGGLSSGECTFTSDSSKRRKLLFAGEGDIENRASILYDNSFLFGALSDSARLYQTNSFRALTITGGAWDWMYITNKVTFCAGNFGSKDGGTAFYCGYADTDVILTSNTVFNSTGATFLYNLGTWHLGSRENHLGDLHPGLTDMTVICDRANAFNTARMFSPYNTSGSPKGYLDLNGFDQETPYCYGQNNDWKETSEWRVYIRSATPAQLIATSTEGETRTRINYWFEGQAGFWLKGTDNVTISRTQSTSSGELRVSGGSLTLNWASSWAGTNIVINGGKLIVDATAGGKYLDQKKYDDMPVFSRKANMSITDGGKLSLGKDVTVRSVRTGADTFLAAGEWGSTESGAKNTDDTLFEGTGKINVRRSTASLQGVTIIVH